MNFIKYIRFSIHSRNNSKLGILLILLATILFSVMWALVKYLTNNYPVNEVTFFRNAISLIPISIMIVMSGRWSILRTKRLQFHFWRSVIGIVSMILGYWSYHLIPIADATALNYIMPLLVTALSAPILKEKVGIHRWCAVAVGFLGALLITNPSNNIFNLGAVTALGSAITMAFIIIMVRKLCMTENPLTIIFYFALFSAIFTSITLPFIWVTPTLTDCILLIILGLLGGIAQYLYTTAFSCAETVIVIPFNYTGLLWATIWGWMFWNEIPKINVFIGSIIVIASGLFLIYHEFHEKSALSR